MQTLTPRRVYTPEDEFMVAYRTRNLGSSEPENALLARAGKGDREALSALLTPFQALLYRICVSQLLSLTEAEDAVQETYVRAIRALTGGKFSQRSSLKTYLIRIAVRVCQDQRKGRRTSVALLDTMLLSAGADETALENATIRDALASVPPGPRTVFLLRDVEGFTRLEAAQALGVTPRRIDYELSLAHRALEDWREKWTESE